MRAAPARRPRLRYRARVAAARFGDYEVLERIGEGGMCQVFRARREDLADDCALKVLKDDARKDPRICDLFLTEADLSLMLRHPNLVRTYDAGEIGGRAYIAMELLDGGTLDRLARRLADEGGRLPDDLALFVVRELLAGLEALHGAKAPSGRPLGVVHRDVTPHNVFLGRDGRVVLGDYGVVHIEAHGASVGGPAPGKLAYLAPEALGPDGVDQRADVYAVGVLLYELLLGGRPFDAPDDATTLDLITEARPTRPRRVRPDLPAGLEAVMESALHRRPAARPRSAGAFREELAPYVDPVLGHGRLLGALVRSLLGASSAG